MEVLAVDGEPVLAADERETRAEFSQGVLQPDGQGLFQRPFGGSFGEVQEVEDVRVLQRLLAMTTAIWHNDSTGQPVKRSLLAFDH